MNEIVLDIWGDFACFSRPESKVERLTYPVITPSAARGVLSAIYSKPVEFYWQVKKIEVLKPIRYMSFKKNEVINSKINRKFSAVVVEENRTQRQNVVLKDVRYRITAEIVKRQSFPGSAEQLYQQARRRIESGKCFFQPSFGLREFVCYFEGASDMPPIQETLDIGIMLYDVFDLKCFGESSMSKPFVTLYHAKLENGVIHVPAFESELVLKPERS